MNQSFLSPLESVHYYVTLSIPHIKYIDMPWSFTRPLEIDVDFDKHTIIDVETINFIFVELQNQGFRGFSREDVETPFLHFLEKTHILLWAHSYNSLRLIMLCYDGVIFFVLLC